MTYVSSDMEQLNPPVVHSYESDAHPRQGLHLVLVAGDEVGCSKARTLPERNH